MDASDFEADVWLQKASAELIADLRQSIPKLLRKPAAEASGTSKLRYRVRMQEVFRLDTLVLGQFLEIPQLLDPHLPELVPQLASAYLEYLQTHGLQSRLRTKSQLIEPLSQAVAHLIYTFCKVRGEKVIVRFLNVETKYIELLLSAIEADFELARPEDLLDSSHDQMNPWTWQERYVILLWLSQLLLAPFDLATISSVDLDDLTLPKISNFEWPANLPGIAVRLLPIATKYLEMPGKERDGAKALLVRMAMRKDMQEMGVLDALINWALKCLEPTVTGPMQSSYYYSGRLGFLAGILRASMDTSDMDGYLVRVFRAVLDLTTGGSTVARFLMASSVARKMIIKVLRSVTALLLRRQERETEVNKDEDTLEFVEMCIAFFMERLADNDTPVRFAASKALSIITLRLPPEMAEQIVEAVLDALNQKVLWVENAKDSTAVKTRDISAVDPLEWHGLTLTLSHLLYRRSPPASQLSDIINALLLGLSFEQRGPSGASIGTNVRDAACFGIWAISRRYTTAELLTVSTESLLVTDSKETNTAEFIIQILATELVVTASRDPAGNIRRGASAALQELIGRHPDTIIKGIDVVQAVDYNAVALRSRAIHQVSLKATKLSTRYGKALQQALLTWRGIGDADAPARRVTGTSFGTLTMEMARMQPRTAVHEFRRAMDMVVDNIDKLQARQAEERHGLLLCIAALLDHVPHLIALVAEHGGKEGQDKTEDVYGFVKQLLEAAISLLQQTQSGTFRREELLAEAASRLSVALLPAIQATLFAHEAKSAGLELLSGSDVLQPEYPERLCAYASVLSSLGQQENTITRIADILRQVLPTWLGFDQQNTVDAVSSASIVYLTLSPPVDQLSVVQSWADATRHKPSNRTGHGYGYFYAVAKSSPMTRIISKANGQADNDIVAAVLLERWRADSEIETHVAILRSLTESNALRLNPSSYLNMLVEGLNNYTTNARGDVGSLVRVAALQAAKSLWRDVSRLEGSSETGSQWLQQSIKQLFPAVLRLAAEKLDRVRAEAQLTLGLVMTKEHYKKFIGLTFSSREYFYTLLKLLGADSLYPLISSYAKADAQVWMTELLAGYVTAAETGNEVLVVNSRAALVQFVSEGQASLDVVAAALMANIRAFQGVDRVLVSSLEVTAFLIHADLLQRSERIDARALCLQAQKAGYKSGNMKKIEACVKIYGGLAQLASAGGTSRMGRSAEAAAEARKRLGALLFHPWPKVRNLVVDEVWALVGEDAAMAAKLKGVNWGAAKKEEIRELVGGLQLE
ncbi:hypothetical protein BROUX41_001610 [Berkeleyomyces rouxiae]|uniref:uncharacterized protein n=1 Tax=Berkeleyomyces rouxiae TaxID=2035830 RepID=UPI003B7BF8A4